MFKEKRINYAIGILTGISILCFLALPFYQLCFIESGDPGIFVTYYGYDFLKIILKAPAVFGGDVVFALFCLFIFLIVILCSLVIIIGLIGIILEFIREEEKKGKKNTLYNVLIFVVMTLLYVMFGLMIAKAANTNGIGFHVKTGMILIYAFFFLLGGFALTKQSKLFFGAAGCTIAFALIPFSVILLVV